jgi:hypothetical protein
MLKARKLRVRWSGKCAAQGGNRTFRSKRSSMIKRSRRLVGRGPRGGGASGCAPKRSSPALLTGSFRNAVCLFGNAARNQDATRVSTGPLPFKWAFAFFSSAVRPGTPPRPQGSLRYAALKSLESKTLLQGIAIGPGRRARNESRSGARTSKRLLMDSAPDSSPDCGRGKFGLQRRRRLH